MMVKIRSAVFRLLVGSCLIASGAQAAALGQGLYENASSSPLIALLDSARSTIDIEIYTMADPLVQKAILNALADHVRVRIVQEPAPIGTACRIFAPRAANEDDGCLALRAFRSKVLKAGGIYVPFTKNLCGPATTGCVQHGKMVIVDAKAALLSTGNFDSTNICNENAVPAIDHCNRDYSYIIRFAPAIKVLGQVFEHDLKGANYDLKSLLKTSGAADLTISPYATAPILKFIRSAKKNLVIQNQYLKDPAMNAEIIAAARRGVDVRVNVSSACGFGKPTPAAAEAWAEVYQAFDAAGVKSRIFTKNVKIAGNFGYLHAKTIVVDGAQAWVGSVNGSTQAFGSNREFGVFFDTPKDVAKLLAYMKSDFNNPNGETWRQSLKCTRDE